MSAMSTGSLCYGLYGFLLRCGSEECTHYAAICKGAHTQVQLRLLQGVWCERRSEEQRRRQQRKHKDLGALEDVNEAAIAESTGGLSQS